MRRWRGLDLFCHALRLIVFAARGCLWRAPSPATPRRAGSRPRPSFARYAPLPLDEAAHLAIQTDRRHGASLTVIIMISLSQKKKGQEFIVTQAKRHSITQSLRPFEITIIYSVHLRIQSQGCPKIRKREACGEARIRDPWYMDVMERPARMSRTSRRPRRVRGPAVKFVYLQAQASSESGSTKKEKAALHSRK